jgi:hypothetical protein
LCGFCAAVKLSTAERFTALGISRERIHVILLYLET